MPEFQLRDLMFDTKIGFGRFSNVYKAHNLRTGEDVAVKVLSKSISSIIDYEIYSNLKLNHRDIIVCDGWFDDYENAYMLFEYAPMGDLWGYLYSLESSLRESEVKHILKPVIRAVAHIHAKKWIHRDIKPENILLFRGLKSKIGDLGLTINTNKRVPISQMGTPPYMAPEMLAIDDEKMALLELKGTPGYGTEIDCWSIGILAYECLMKKVPFDGSIDDIRLQLECLNIDFGNMSENARDFIRGCLDPTPNKRMKAKDMLQHPWFNEKKCCMTFY